MKKNNRIPTTLVASIALIAFIGPALAQFNPAADDGLAASPKVRQHIAEYKANQNVAPGAPAATTQMSCPKCKDAWVRRTDNSARGARKPVISVPVHQCKSCGTEWKVAGTGRARQSVASHVCAICGTDNMSCCSSGGTVTKGM